MRNRSVALNECIFSELRPAFNESYLCSPKELELSAFLKSVLPNLNLNLNLNYEENNCTNYKLKNYRFKREKAGTERNIGSLLLSLAACFFGYCLRVTNEDARKALLICIVWHCLFTSITERSFLIPIGMKVMVQGENRPWHYSQCPLITWRQLFVPHIGQGSGEKKDLLFTLLAMSTKILIMYF